MINVIDTEEDYNNAIIRLDAIFNSTIPEEIEELLILVDLIEKYEDKNYPI